MFKKFLENIQKGSNPAIILNALIAYLLVIGGATYVTRPHLNKHPCVICGRADTTPVSTLWQFKTLPVPRVAEKSIWYCKRHIEHAPDFIFELPPERDTVRQRFAIEIIVSCLSLFLFLYSLIVMDFKLTIVFLHPVLLAGIFLIFGVTANRTMSFSFALLILFPLITFYLWQKYYS